jgi:hypothetical protein
MIDSLIAKLEEIRTVADDLAYRLTDAATPPDLAVAKALVDADRIVTKLWGIEAKLGALTPKAAGADQAGGKRKKAEVRDGE